MSVYVQQYLCSLDKIFLSYGDDISSSCNLISFITDIFLNDIITYAIIYILYFANTVQHKVDKLKQSKKARTIRTIYRVHVYLVKFLFFCFMLLPVGEIKTNIGLYSTRKPSHDVAPTF